MRTEKKTIALILAAVLTLSLIGCAGKPAETTAPPETTAPVETTVPPTTVPPTTVPPETTEPAIPDTYLCLDEMIAGSDITITLEGTDIILEENGLIVNMSADSKKLTRNFDLTGIMKDVARIKDGLVYIHGDSFRYFFCKEGSDEVSLFHGSLFYVVEVLDALMHPDESEFNRKLAENVCLPGSMGVEVPRLNEDRIYLEGIWDNTYYWEAQSYGYPEANTQSEFVLIMNARTLKEAGLSDTDDVTTVGEYKRTHIEWDERMSEEDIAFFTEKGILNEDYWFLYQWFHGQFKNASDEKLIEALETCYRAELMFKLEWMYPEE